MITVNGDAHTDHQQRPHIAGKTNPRCYAESLQTGGRRRRGQVPPRAAGVLLVTQGAGVTAQGRREAAHETTGPEERRGAGLQGRHQQDQHAGWEPRPTRGPSSRLLARWGSSVVSTCQAENHTQVTPCMWVWAGLFKVNNGAAERPRCLFTKGC